MAANAGQRSMLFELGMRRISKKLSREQEMGANLVHILRHPNNPPLSSALRLLPQSGAAAAAPQSVLEYAFSSVLQAKLPSRLSQPLKLTPPVANELLARHSKQINGDLLVASVETCTELPHNNVELDFTDMRLCKAVFSRLNEENVQTYPQAASVCLRMLPNSAAFDLLCRIPQLPDDEPVWQAFQTRSSDAKWDRVAFSDALLHRIVKHEFALGNFRYVADLFRNKSPQQQHVINETCRETYSEKPSFKARQFLGSLLPATQTPIKDTVQDDTNFKLFRDTKLFQASAFMWEKRRAVLNLAFEQFESEEELLHEIALCDRYVDFVDMTDAELGFALKHLYLQPQATDKVQTGIEHILRARGASSPATYRFFLHEKDQQQTRVHAGERRWNAFHSFRALVNEATMPVLPLSKACSVWRALETSGYTLHASEEYLLYDLFRQAPHSNDDAKQMESWLAGATYSRLNTVAMAGYFAKNDNEQDAPKQSSRWDFFKRLFKATLLKDTPESWQYIKRYLSASTAKHDIDLATMDLLKTGLLLQRETEADLQQWFLQDGLYGKICNALLKRDPYLPQLTNSAGMIDLSACTTAEEEEMESEFDWNTNLISQVPATSTSDELLLGILVTVFQPWLVNMATNNKVNKSQHRIQMDLAQIVDLKTREMHQMSMTEASLLCHLAAIATLQDRALPPAGSVHSKQALNDMRSRSPLQLWKNERIAQLPAVLALERSEDSEQNRIVALQLCANLTILASSLSDRNVLHLQRALYALLHPQHPQTNVICFAQMSMLQALKPELNLVDLKFVLKTVGFISVCDESKPISLALLYLNKIFSSALKKNQNQMLLEPLFDRCIDILLKKMQFEFPQFKQDDPEFLPAVSRSFELISKILEFSADNLPGYQYKVFEQKKLAEFCLQYFLNPHQDFPVEILRQVFLVLQNLFAFERRITTDICSSVEKEFVISKLDWAIAHPQVRQNEGLALAVMNAYFALIHANPDAYLDVVGKYAVEQLELKVKKIEMHSFEFHSRGFNMSFEEFSTLDIYLVSEEFRDFLTKLAKRG